MKKSERKMKGDGKRRVTQIFISSKLYSHGSHVPLMSRSGGKLKWFKKKKSSRRRESDR